MSWWLQISLHFDQFCRLYLHNYQLPMCQSSVLMVVEAEVGPLELELEEVRENSVDGVAESLKTYDWFEDLN